MKNDEKIQTKHPEGKKGVTISKVTYNFIKSYILKTIKQHKEISFKELTLLAKKELNNEFENRISWYIVKVKLDLEARGLIIRVPKTSPHKLKLVKKDYSITKHFGSNLAELLSAKIIPIYSSFDSKSYIKSIAKKCPKKTYTQRIELHATALKDYLPTDYKKAITILLKILGEENPNQTGMFSNYYWILPLGKFVEKYGLDDYKLSIYALSEITTRNTGEYAIRPFIRKYPKKTLLVMKEWANSKNFHLRRLASEGLRPKLPWATKLETFIDNPKPVFEILEILKEDSIKFVQKSVANHLTDYLKVNSEPTIELLKEWNKSKNINTQWIVKQATRKIKVLD